MAGLDTIAIGASSRAGNNYAIALGSGAVANKRQSIAIGHGARVEWSGQQADDGRGNGIAIGTNAFVRDQANGGIAIGSNAGVESGNHSVAIGSGARANGTIVTAIGGLSRASGDTNISVGERTQTAGFDTSAFGIYATAGRDQQGRGVMSASAFGAHAAAQGRGSTAMGAGSLVFGQGSGSIAANSPVTSRVYGDPKDQSAFSLIGGSNNFSVGNRNVIGSTSANNVAFGNDIHIGASGASFAEQLMTQGSTSDLRYLVPTFQGQVAISNAVAVGTAAKVDASDTLALGSNSRATMFRGVALGSGSVTAAATPTASGNVGGVDYAYAGTAPTSVVSIGTAGNERQVQNVAAGRVSAASTDAINGSQLYATQVAVGNMAVSVATHLGGGAVVNADGSIGAPVYTIAGTDYNNVGDALAAIQVGVAAAQTHYFSVNSTGGGNYNNTGASGVDAIAIGKDAVAAHDGSVALGQGASTAAAVGTSGTTIAGVNYGFAGTAPTGTVSVGSAGTERTITNVAAGRIAADSTDAVNGSQLHATNQAIEAVDGRVTNLEVTVGGIAGDIVNLNNDVTALQTGAAGMFQVSQDVTTPPPAPTGTNSAAGGAGAVASGDNSTAVGNGSTASGIGSTAIGNGASASGDGSIAIGVGSVASDPNTLSVGSAGNERRITNVAAGVNPTDAVNVSQLQGFAAGGVQYDKNADGSVNRGSVTLNPGGTGPTTIHNVAAGVAPTDAVNVGQLNAGLANVLSQANAYTDNSIRQLRDDMWTTNRGYRAATASAMAMSGLPQPYLPGKSMLSVGAGGYQGEYGLAVGLSGITEDGRWVYKAQASGNTSDDWGFAVGAGIQW